MAAARAPSRSIASHAWSARLPVSASARWASAGSRDETDAVAGVSHFLEHMIFKGTGSRTSPQIAKQLDAIGGLSNAFTSTEYTCFHSRVLEKDVRVLVDILSDIFLNSLFDPQDIGRERQVILQEINMLEDTPDEQVHVLTTSGAIENTTAAEWVSLRLRNYRPTEGGIVAFDLLTEWAEFGLYLFVPQGQHLRLYPEMTANEFTAHDLAARMLPAQSDLQLRHEAQGAQADPDNAPGIDPIEEPVEHFPVAVAPAGVIDQRVEMESQPVAPIETAPGGREALADGRGPGFLAAPQGFGVERPGDDGVTAVVEGGQMVHMIGLGLELEHGIGVAGEPGHEEGAEAGPGVEQQGVGEFAGTDSIQPLGVAAQFRFELCSPHAYVLSTTSASPGSSRSIDAHCGD